MTPEDYYANHGAACGAKLPGASLYPTGQRGAYRGLRYGDSTAMEKRRMG